MSIMPASTARRELRRIPLPETVWKVPTGTESGLHGPRRGVKRPYFRVVGERSSLVEAPPTDFPDSLWKGNSAKLNLRFTECYEVRCCAQSMEKDCPPSWISGCMLQGRGRQISNSCGPTPDVVHARPADHREGRVGDRHGPVLDPPHAP